MFNNKIKSASSSSDKVLMPPLGRMMTPSTTKFMREMLNHPEVKDSLQAIF